MSNIALLESEQFTVDRAWHDDYNTYRETEATFDGWHITRRMEWKKSDNRLRHDYMKIWRGESDWYSVEVDGKGGSWREPITEYQIGFSGHGRLDIEAATFKLDLLSVGLAIAKELTAQVTGDGIVAPKLSDDQNKWTDLITKTEHQRGE